MIPKGPIFAQLRAQMLGFYPLAIPSGSPATSLGEWLRMGTYVPTQLSKTKYEIQASQSDVGAVILSETEALMNHAFEHLQEVLCFNDDLRTRSDAWNVVTIYYLAFFSAQALLRLIGSPVSFLSIDDLKLLTLRPGAFTLELKRGISATQSIYELKHVDKRLHESTWNLLLKTIDAMARDKKLATDRDEVLLFSAIARNTRAVWSGSHHDWPSHVRNRANYRPGFAYKLVGGQVIAKTKNLMGDWGGSALNIPRILDSSAISSVGANEGLFDKDVRFLHHSALTIFLLARSLYTDLVGRSKIDKRAELQRTQFRGRMIWDRALVGFQKAI